MTAGKTKKKKSELVVREEGVLDGQTRLWGHARPFFHPRPPASLSHAPPSLLAVAAHALRSPPQEGRA